MASLFDLDGTILGNYREKGEIRNELARKYGLPGIEAEEYYEVFRQVIHDNKVNDRVPVFERFVEEKAIAERIAEEYGKISLENTFIYPDAEEVLREIKSEKGLVTDGPSLTQRRKIEKFELEKYFDCIVISGEVGYSKPGKEIFRIALDSLDASAEESLYVGNVPEIDVVGARRAGLVSVLVNREGRSYEGSNPYSEPDYEIGDMRDLYGIIEGEGIT